ncbi:MAG: energy transducer TonB [Bryobacteraceae bacterium]
MRTLAIAFLMLAVLPAGRHAMAADSAASLIEAVSRNASNADTWEAEGRLVTQETADDAGPRTAASFRIVIERVPEQRARLEITGVPAPLTRVCDGSIQWGHLPAVRLFWSVGDSRIDACAEPFDEWPYLAADLHDPVITGREQLQPGKKVIECTVVSGDYAGSDASRSGKRTLWIDEVTNAIWQYRVERGASSLSHQAEPAVRIYTLLRQTSGAVPQSGDFALQHPDECVRLAHAPALRLGDGAPLTAGDQVGQHAVYSIGPGISAPILTHKIQPKYTKEAWNARVEGLVVLYVEVWSDEAAHNVRVLRSLDPGLDQRALEAVSKWRFRPGMKDGVPVKVASQIEVNFRLEN